MIFLWILVVLAVFAVGIGYRVSTGIKFCRAKEASLKARYLAYAGVNRAIVEIKGTSAAGLLDALNSKWADNEGIFKKISLNDSPNDFAVVFSEEGKYGVIDEERKININSASRELLIALLQEFNITTPEDVADNILIWRGNLPDTLKIYESMGYPCKGQPFSNIEELKLVKGISTEDFDKLEGLITVASSGSLNINTVTPTVLRIFCRGIALQPSINLNPDFGNSVAEKIIALRNSHGPFDLAVDQIQDLAFFQTDELNIFTALSSQLICRSENFLIEVTGNSRTIESKISAIYSRTNDKINYWHEN